MSNRKSHSIAASKRHAIMKIIREHNIRQREEEAAEEARPKISAKGVRKAITFYRHETFRVKRWMLQRGVFSSDVVSWEASAEQNAADGTWSASLPLGCLISGYETEDLAVEAAIHSLIASGYTTDRGIALKRATKEVEMRKSGRIRFSGKNKSTPEELKLATAEIFSIESTKS